MATKKVSKKTKITKVLIANRGEIALRVIRACKEMGIKSVAVYSEADQDALHVKNADEAICIGPPESAQSYLDIDKIIDAAKQTKANAIHPGYGFLSENPLFAEACAKNKITFIGPSAKAMRAIGNKTSARELMEKANVPVAPGKNDVDRNDTKAILREIKRIGVPLLVKASAGGGGRGIRLIEKESEALEIIDLAANEAASAFGDATIFLEKFVTGARHIEVQIMADAYGNVVAFGERDCSIQRRNQKLIEESPSPAVDEELRTAICNAAIEAAKSCNYQNAGTVEFLLDEKTRQFYFLEVNARLQVEHPVTELVYSVDLVKTQLRVAQGESLTKLFPEQPTRNGWSIECRINGEDPFSDFMPSLGLIGNLDLPSGPGVRFDSMIYEGLDVPLFYDSLLGKLITWGVDREEAITRMKRALKELQIGGIQTNIPFHVELMNHKAFVSGAFHTNWLEENFTMPVKEDIEDNTLLAIIGASLSLNSTNHENTQESQQGQTNNWARAGRIFSMRRDFRSSGWQ